LLNNSTLVCTFVFCLFKVSTHSSLRLWSSEEKTIKILLEICYFSSEKVPFQSHLLLLGDLLSLLNCQYFKSWELIVLGLIQLYRSPPWFLRFGLHLLLFRFWGPSLQIEHFHIILFLKFRFLLFSITSEIFSMLYSLKSLLIALEIFYFL